MNRAIILIGLACALASAQTWDTLAPLPAPRYSGAAVVLNDMVYYLGGSVTGGVKTASVLVYNPVADSWTLGDSMLTARHRFGAVECNASLYVFGGWGNGGELLNSAECYDPGRAGVDPNRNDAHAARQPVCRSSERQGLRHRRLERHVGGQRGRGI